MCRHYEGLFYGGRVCALLEKVKIISVLSLSAMSALKCKVCFGKLVRSGCDRGSRPKRMANNGGWTLLYFLT